MPHLTGDRRSWKELENALVWLAALAILGALGWILWRSARPGFPPSAAPPPSGRPRVIAPGPRPERATFTETQLKPTKPKANPSSPRLSPQAAVPNTVQPGPANPGAPNPPAPPVPNPATTYVEPAAFAGFPRPAQSVFEAQLALDRLGISPGSIDGARGPQTRLALRAFQRKEKLPITGELDEMVKERLMVAAPPCATRAITAGDLARLQPLSPTWLGKSQQSALEYETILELVAEKGHANPNLVRRLNPGVDWSAVTPGTMVTLPDVTRPETDAKAAFITIHLADKVLEAFDADTNLLAHFPCSIGRRVETRPVGVLHVEAIAPHPNYTFDPEVFPESAEARQLKTKLVLPPGPNNPVGVAWIGLDKPGYGIHGTPSPEQVGRTESHGCFRLANWNAEYLLRLVTIGTPVYVEP
jgi:lipoprotein-anchoring transpeptidase ErfK/SrfK